MFLSLLRKAKKNNIFIIKDLSLQSGLTNLILRIVFRFFIAKLLSLKVFGRIQDNLSNILDFIPKNVQWPNLKNLSGGLNLSRGLNMDGST